MNKRSQHLIQRKLNGLQAELAEALPTKKLSSALNLSPSAVVSLVGAGGKTSAALRLMDELAQAGRRVVFTTTTKILEPIPRADE